MSTNGQGRPTFFLFFLFFLGLTVTVLALVDLHWTHWVLTDRPAVHTKQGAR